MNMAARTIQTETATRFFGCGSTVRTATTVTTMTTTPWGVA